MPTLETELATALRAARTKRMFFALIAKGLDGKLLVDKKKIPAKEIADAKKECGGSTIYRGRCLGEDNGTTLVFEVVQEPPGTLAATARKIIKEHAGLVFKAVEFRVVADAEDEADEHEHEAPPSAVGQSPMPTASVPPDAANKRCADRLKVLVPLLQHALATGKPQAEQAKAKLVQANAAFHSNAIDKADALLDQVEPLIKQVLADVVKPAAVPPAPIVKPATPPAPTLNPAAPPVDVGQPAAPSTGADDRQAWQTKLNSIEPLYLAALKANAADAKKLRALMDYAIGKAGAGEYGKALAALKQLEPILHQATAKPAGLDAGVSPVQGDFFKEWHAAKADLQIAIDKVSKQLAHFAVAILETNEENLVWVAEEGLSQLLSSLRDSAITIERATSKTPAKVVSRAKPAIEKLRKQLQSPEVKACDQNQLSVTVTIKSIVGQAIKRLEEALALANAG